MNKKGKGNVKGSQEISIEKRLKFFICSVTFNGSDGHLLPTLNDVHEDKILRDEEPCEKFDERIIYPCEPSPLLVSACLVKTLKHQNEVQSSKSNRSPRNRRSRKKNLLYRGTQPSFSGMPIVHMPSNMLSYNDRMNTDVMNRYNEVSSLPPTNVSILKQLLLAGDCRAIQQPSCFQQNGAYSNTVINSQTPYRLQNIPEFNTTTQSKEISIEEETSNALNSIL